MQRLFRGEILFTRDGRSLICICKFPARALSGMFYAVSGLTWLSEGHVMPFLKVGRPEARRLAHLHTHRPAEHGAADQRALSPRPHRHTITSTF